jgi:hypothetical protein
MPKSGNAATELFLLLTCTAWTYVADKEAQVDVAPYLCAHGYTHCALKMNFSSKNVKTQLEN